MELVKIGTKKYQDYFKFMDKETKEELDNLIHKFRDKKIAMVNAAAYGGGVAEILHSMVPLMRNMGLEIDWWKMYGEEEFYNVTKLFHNRLQGEEGHLSNEDINIYLQYNTINAMKIKNWDYNFTVIHDPQPAALIEFKEMIAGKNSKWIWRCHIDTSTPNTAYWDFMYKYISKFDALVFTMKDFVRPDLNLNNVNFITPSIDPKSSKNIPLGIDEAKKIVRKFGVDTTRPLISQISRFDPWKDPLGVIEVYKIIKKEFPSVQLALVGSMASDDPEGWDYLYKTLRRAGEDYDIKIITNFNGVSNIEVNAFQTASDVLLQKSLKEGFGLTVAEGMWKGTPVIGGNTGGIKLQIEDGVTGYLVDTVEECARKVLILLRNPVFAKDIIVAGREKVKREYLITKGILNYLRLFNKLNCY